MKFDKKILCDSTNILIRRYPEMAVMRIHKNRNYTVISNVHLRDKRMSLKAKGLLTLMLSLPDDWDYSVDGLCSICKENRTAIQSALRELEVCRYLKRTKERNDKGQFECIYEIFEVPQYDSGTDGTTAGVRRNRLCLNRRKSFICQSRTATCAGSMPIL